MHPFILPIVRLLSLLFIFSMLCGTSGIGQIYCYKKELCPTIKRISYDIPPVTDRDTGILDDFKEILNSFEPPDVLDLLLKKNKSENEEYIQPTTAHVSKRIRNLELMYYKYLPSDRTIALVILVLLICALCPTVMDYFMLTGALVIAYQYVDFVQRR